METATEGSGRTRGPLPLPADSVLLPISSGALLVSRSHATFCAVPTAQLARVAAVLADERDVVDLPPDLVADLERHGFFGPPRPPEPPAPSVQLQLTNACNLACGYCCTNSGRARATELDRAAFEAAVRDTAAAMPRGARIAFLGGEPLAVPFAPDLCTLALDLGLSPTLFTNGMALRDCDLARRIAELVARGLVVRVSLAGATRDTCDRASGTARFDDAIAGIAALAAAGGRAQVDLMLLPSDVDEVAASLHDLRALLPPGTVVALGIAFDGGREAGEHVFPDRTALESSLDRVAFGAGERVDAEAPAPIAWRREGCTCALGHHLHVRSDGALFSCFRMEEPIGDLHRERFGDALRRLPATVAPASDLPTCRDCPLATLCGGGCRSDNVRWTGDGGVPACGPWRVRVLSELLAEDRPGAVEWPSAHLLAEAHRRGIEAPERLQPVLSSRHLTDV